MSKDHERGTSPERDFVGRGFGSSAVELSEDDRIRPAVFVLVLGIVLPLLLFVGIAFLVRFSQGAGQFASVAVLTLEKRSSGIARLLRPWLGVRIEGSEQELWNRLASNDLYSMGILIGAGWSPNISDPKGHSLLRAAVESGNVDAVSFLLDRGADANRRDTDDETPLTAAVRSGNLVITQLLLSHGATVGEMGPAGLRPIDIAGRAGGASICEILLKAGAEARSANSLGFVPLDYAVQSDNVNSVKLFLDRGADALRVDPDGFNPLLRAVLEKNGEMVGLLMKTPSVLTAPSVNGRSVKEIANERHLDVNIAPDGRIRVIPLIKFPQVQSEEAEFDSAVEGSGNEVPPIANVPVRRIPLGTVVPGQNNMPNQVGTGVRQPGVVQNRVTDAADKITTLRALGGPEGTWIKSGGVVQLTKVIAKVRNAGEYIAKGIKIYATLPGVEPIPLRGPSTLSPNEIDEFKGLPSGVKITGSAVIKLELTCDNCEAR